MLPGTNGRNQMLTTDQIATLAVIAYITLLALGGLLGLRAACSDRKRAARKPPEVRELW